MKKLFNKKAEVAKPQVDPHEQLQKLTNQCQVIEKRISVLDKRQTDHKSQAIAKKRSGDQRGALLELKKSKMVEKELAKLNGHLMLLEQ